MTSEEFDLKASTALSDNPYDRINLSVKELLQKEDLIIDVHAHIFDSDSVPTPYLQARIFDFLKNIGYTGKLEKLIEQAVENSLNSRINLLMNFASNLLHFFLPINNREEMYQYYRNNITKKYKHLIFISLMMDIEKGWKSTPKKLIPEQIKEVKALVKQNFPILPFFAVDPRKEDLFDNFLSAFTGDINFFGVKVYPALGFLPNDSRLLPVFKICREKNIPVTTHCGGTLIASVSKDVCNSYPETIQAQADGKCEDYKGRAAFFNHPQLWEPVLQKFPDLRLNFGHFGGIDDWSNIKKGLNAERIETIIHFMSKKTGLELTYKNVYSDFSYNLKKKKRLVSVLKEKLDKNPLLRQKAMFGTDYWVVNPLAPKKLKKEINATFKSIQPYFEEFSKTNALNFLGLNH